MTDAELGGHDPPGAQISRGSTQSIRNGLNCFREHPLISLALLGGINATSSAEDVIALLEATPGLDSDLLATLKTEIEAGTHHSCSPRATSPPAHMNHARLATSPPGHR